MHISIEPYVDIVGVTGSIPVTPTISPQQYQWLSKFGRGDHASALSFVTLVSHGSFSAWLRKASTNGFHQKTERQIPSTSPHQWAKHIKDLYKPSPCKILGKAHGDEG